MVRVSPILGVTCRISGDSFGDTLKVGFVPRFVPLIAVLSPLNPYFLRRGTQGTDKSKQLHKVTVKRLSVCRLFLCRGL